VAKKRRTHIVIAILIVWIAFFITDFSLAKANKSPVFAIPVIRYKDGGSTEFYGLGYKVIKYINLTVERGPEVESVAFGTWLMRFSDTLSVPGNDGEVIKEPNEVVWDRRTMVMLKGELYLDTGHESDIDGRCGVMDGEISSTVDGSEIPTQDNQSNFGDGYEYQYVDRNSVDIYMNGKWIRFEKETMEEVMNLSMNSEEDLGLEDLKGYHFEPNVSIIEGKLIKRMYYGPPNYGENPDTDAKQYPFILLLDDPIDVIALEDDIHNSDKLEVTEIQVVPKNKEETELVEQYINKRITIQGTLFEAIFGGHHTDVLIYVERILD